jgi:D-alanyl-D-alanine carboxypeptidase/D-alanyl-D-alanine-endopeptidase (penicillin-binding protein 4)
MKNLITSLVAACMSLSAQAINLTGLLDNAIENALPSAHFSMTVIDPRDQSIVYQHESGRYLTPASNTKLFTALASLYELGADFNFETTLSYNPKQVSKKILKGDLYIKFTGDPSLSSNDILKLLSQLPIKQIKGNIILDDTQYELPNIAPGTSVDDLGWYYAAPVSAIIINENAFKATFSATDDHKLSIKPNENTFGISVKSHAHIQKNKTCSQTFIYPDAYTIIFNGCWTQPDRQETVAISEPFNWAAQIIKTNLQIEKISFSGVIKKGVRPATVQQQWVHKSKPLSELIKHMLHTSDNIYADSIEKRIADKPGNYKKGADKIKQVLSNKLYLNLNDAHIADGAGTRYNSVTTLQLAAMLSKAYQDKLVKDDLINALPVSGERGTLKTRMLDLKGIVYAKTGAMHDVSSLSGYLMQANNKVLAFSMITNHYNGDIQQVKKFEDALIRMLWSNT